MKKLILLSTFALISLTAYSQTDSLPTVKTIYCELVGLYAYGSIIVTIDIGEDKGFWGLHGAYLKDTQTGKPMKFNGMVDAMNYMSDHGWEFVQAYGTPTAAHFLLKTTAIRRDDGNYYPELRRY